MTKHRETSFEFFYKHAGYSYHPDTQTPEQGRRECAQALADADRAGSDAGLSFEWEVDQCCDSSDFDDSPDPWQLWCCCCRDIDGDVVASLGGIDFGRDGQPWDQSYRRVVEAELASEALAD